MAAAVFDDPASLTSFDLGGCDRHFAVASRNVEHISGLLPPATVRKVINARDIWLRRVHVARYFATP